MVPRTKLFLPSQKPEGGKQEEEEKEEGGEKTENGEDVHIYDCVRRERSDGRRGGTRRSL